MLNHTLKNDSTGKIFSILFYALFEMSAPEEKKRLIWKQLLEAGQKGEKIDLTLLGDPKDFSLENLFDRPVSVEWHNHRASEITRK